MGVRGLYHYCKPFLKPVVVKKELRIGIDASSLLYRFQGNFEEIEMFLLPLLENKLLFVFDGKAPKYKEKELEIRKSAKDIAQMRIDTLNNSLLSVTNNETYSLIQHRIKQLERENWYLTYTIKQEFKKFLYKRKLSYVKSIQEADALLIDLYYNNFIDAVLSNDMDYLVAGIKLMYVPVKGKLTELHLDEILNYEEINSEQFKEAAILSGIDNVRIFICDDVSISISFIRHYGSIHSMREKQGNLFTDNCDIQEIKKRFYPNKNAYIYLKPDHKDTLDKFNERMEFTS